jgi:hypothetical protein
VAITSEQARREVLHSLSGFGYACRFLGGSSVVPDASAAANQTALSSSSVKKYLWNPSADSLALRKRNCGSSACKASAHQLISKTSSLICISQNGVRQLNHGQGHCSSASGRGQGAGHRQYGSLHGEDRDTSLLQQHRTACSL